MIQYILKWSLKSATSPSQQFIINLIQCQMESFDNSLLDNLIYSQMESQIDYESFLNQHQRHTLQLQVQAIAHQLHLPATVSALKNAAQHSHILTSLSEVDPTGIIFTQKLIEINRIAVVELFGQCVYFLTNKIKASIDLFIEQKNIKYAVPQFEEFVRSKCKYVEFAWQDESPQRGSLWNRLTQAVSKLLQITLYFITIRYEMSELGGKEQLQNAMLAFEKELQPCRNKLQNMYPLDELLTQSLIKYKQEESESMKMYKSEIGDAIDQLEQLQKAQEQDQEMAVQTEQKEEKSILDMFQSTSTKIYSRLSSIFTQEETVAFKKETETDLNNLQTPLELNQEDTQTVKNVEYLDINTLNELIACCLTEAQISTLQFSIKKPLMDWQAEELLITGAGKLVQSNYLKLCRYRQNLNEVLKTIRTGQEINEDKFLIIALLFYRALEQDYTSLARRYLAKVLETIELMFAHQKCRYLRGALREYETVHLKPSILAIQLQSQLPYRSASFQQSMKSKIRRESDFGGFARQSTEQFKKGEHLKFQRLNYAKPTKNVTFLISGFLSKDTQKDLQWLGVIRAIEETELYGVIWRSGTKVELLNYVGAAVGSLALKGLQAQGGNLMTLVQVAQVGLKVANFFKRKVDQKKSNPFWGSLVNAKQTGIELANKLVAQFSDRHITLVGFSMGTEVIVSCLQRLIELKQEKLILKIVTMGGVADRDNVHNIIQSSEQPLAWINFQSRRDYAVKYVYRVCTLGSKPIGSDGIPQVCGHQVLNWEVGSVVNGHMDFRTNLHGLCLLAGLKND